MRQVLTIGGWSVFTLGVLTLLFFTNAGYDNLETSKPDITIEKPGGHNFVTEEKVLLIMNDLGYSFDKQSLGEIDLKRIEEKVAAIPGVKSVEAYKFNSGKVKLDIKQQLPIARIFLHGGKMGCYMDSEGDIIPLSYDYVAKVPVFTGFIYEPINDIPNLKRITENDSISKLHVLDEIFYLASAIAKDEFMSAQIVQIYVNENEEFELIPRVGNHRILFGGIKDLDSKLERLTTFYTSSSFDVKELNLYDTLNLKYKDQIVCSKRGY
jgi:cell division protein FtsQ